MTDAKKYLFDLNGYLVIENVLIADELALANKAVDRHLDRGRVRPRKQRLDGDSPAKGTHGRGELRDLIGPTVYEKGIRDLSGDYLSDYNTPPTTRCVRRHATRDVLIRG